MEKSEEHKGYEMFVNSLSKEQLINFMMNQQKAIDGLTQNNESFLIFFKNKCKG